MRNQVHIVSIWPALALLSVLAGRAGLVEGLRASQQASSYEDIVRQHESAAAAAALAAQDASAEEAEAREEMQDSEAKANRQGFIGDIIERLHALDADIGKLLHSSDGPRESPADHFKGGERFTEVLTDLDSLQDEIGQLVQNATKTRQYNILVRLRPLNNLLYRIRHNLHLMRNSLVAINTVSRLERIGNNALDTSLTVFMQPEVSAGRPDDDKYGVDEERRVDDTVATQSPDNRTETAAPAATQARASTPSTAAATSPTSAPSSPSSPSSTTTSTTTTSTTTTTTTRAPTSARGRERSTKPPATSTEAPAEQSRAPSSTSVASTKLPALAASTPAPATTSRKPAQRRPAGNRTRRPNSRTSSSRSTPASNATSPASLASSASPASPAQG